MQLLVIDDEPLIGESIRAAFENESVIYCETAQKGIEQFLRATPDVVLCDIRLPDMSGLEAFERLHRIDTRVPIILMTGFGTASTAIEAMQHGAFEYVLKPLDLDQLIPLIDNAAETNRMLRVPTLISDAPSFNDVDPGVDVIIGQCPAMQEVYRSIGRVAKQNVNVLILGESGTGKEVVARALYQYGSRPNGRFMAINCAAVPEQLLESELFGHEKGAFTGADTRRIGKFELCDQGTLFLDEIGEMSPLMQSKLLRILQDQSFERLGGNQTIRTHARIIAATNRDLLESIRKNEFREDLYYRLNVYSIQLPPLRERGADIALLANFYAKRFSREMHKEFNAFAESSIQFLNQYTWPGNVRELQSVIKRALLESSSPVLHPNMLAISSRSVEPNHGTLPPNLASPRNHRLTNDYVSLVKFALDANSEDIYRQVITQAEKDVIQTVLDFTHGNLSEAARRLGITRSTLRSKMTALELTPDKTTIADS